MCRFQTVPLKGKDVPAPGPFAFPAGWNGDMVVWAILGHTEQAQHPRDEIRTLTQPWMANAQMITREKNQPPSHVRYYYLGLLKTQIFGSAKPKTDMPKKPFLGQKCQFSVANKCFKRGGVVCQGPAPFQHRGCLCTVTLVHAKIRILGSVLQHRDEWKVEKCKCCC